MAGIARGQGLQFGSGITRRIAKGQNCNRVGGRGEAVQDRGIVARIVWRRIENAAAPCEGQREQDKQGPVNGHSASSPADAGDADSGVSPALVFPAALYPILPLSMREAPTQSAAAPTAVPSLVGGGRRLVGSPVEAGDQRQDAPLDVLCTQRTDMAVTDAPGGIDDIGLGHAVDPEIDRRRAAAVDTDAAIGLAEIVEKAPRVGDSVFV